MEESEITKEFSKGRGGGRHGFKKKGGGNSTKNNNHPQRMSF